MKQKDLAVIIGVAFLSAILSFVIAGKLFSTPANREQQVETVQAVSTQFSQPDPRYFNAQAIDPTKFIQIGNNADQAPFNAQSNQ